MSGIIEGLTFEKNLAEILKSSCTTVYLDKEVVKKYGSLCSGVDIVAIYDNKIILVQCKRQQNSASIQQVNHFIRGALYIQKKEQLEYQMFWVCKTKPTYVAVNSLTIDDAIIVNDDDQKVCTEKSIIEFSKFFDK